MKTLLITAVALSTILSATPAAGASEETSAELAREFLRAHPVENISDPYVDLAFYDAVDRDGVTHVLFRQVLRGAEVLGSEVAVSIDRTGVAAVERVDTVTATSAPSAEPNLSASDVIALARKVLGGPLSPESFAKLYLVRKGQLEAPANKTADLLAWQVQGFYRTHAGGSMQFAIWIDAATGDILNRYETPGVPPL